MKLGWKVLIPASLIWLLVVAAFRTLTIENVSGRDRFVYVGIAFAVVLFVVAFWPQKKVVNPPEAAHEEHPPIAVGNRAFPVDLRPARHVDARHAGRCASRRSFRVRASMGH